MPTRKGSSRRKPAVIRHITAQEDEDSDELPEVRLEPSDSPADVQDEEETASPLEKIEEDEEANEDVTEIDDEEEEVNEEKEAVSEDGEEEEAQMVNGNGEEVKITTDEKGNEVLPDGTLVLQPVEVSEDDEFSGPEFKSRKKSAPSELEGTYNCTSCHEQLNHHNPKHVSKHPLLGVLLCRHCSKYLSSGNFDIDDEGSEDQCRWCGEGGNLVCCDACPKAFCRSCIKTNLGRKELRAILASEDEPWHCYVCSPAPLVKLQEDCENVLFYIKKQSEAKEQKAKAKSKPAKVSKSTDDEGGNELLKVMQLIGDKSGSKDLLDNLVKGRSPKGLRQTLSLFKDIRKISEDLEHRIRNELNEDEEEVNGKSEKGQEKKEESDDEEEEESGSEKSKKKPRRKKDESDEESIDDGKKSPRRLKKTSKDKRSKTASTSPSEDDVPGTSNGSVKGNKAGRKGRRSLFKAQQKEKKEASSSSESEEESGSESSEEDSDWEEESGVKERRSKRTSKKGKAGGKLAAKKGKVSTSDEESDEDSDDKDTKKKKKKSKTKSNKDDSDSEIEFPKKKKKKKRGPGADSSNLEENSSAEDDGDKKKKKRTKKSKEGDISLSSDSDEEEESGEGASGDSSAEEDRKKIKKAKQNAEKGTKENKKELESDTEDKIAERLLMEEAEEEEESKSDETSDSDLDDAKKKRDKRKKKKDKTSDKKASDKKDRKRKKKSSSDDEEDENSKDSNEEEEEVKDKKNKKSKKKKKKHHLLEVKISESESDEDSSKKKKKKKTKRKPAKKKKKEDSDDLMTSAESSSDSDVQPKKKKGKKRKAKKDESTEDEIKDRSYKKKKGKRRRIKVASASESGSDAAKKSDSSVKEASGSGSDNKDTPGKHRKQIRKVLKKSKLLKTTLEAELAEKERRERIKKRRKQLFGEEESPEKCIRLKELVLEYGSKKKEKIVEVDKEIVVNLKPHQVEGVQFLWDSTFETVEKKDEDGGGAILAHCMGLGKTLQVITYLHTIMSRDDLGIKRALVVAPLNTVLNWVDEFNKWLSFDDSIDVYEITSIKNNEARADMLEQWHEEGGVLIMGYSMYRILAYNPKLKKKRLKRIFRETLVDPGPEVVVCDEGHMLKNDQTAIAKALNSVKTRRRVCLTGTPLQNNLVEYHCMVDFVKPNLLGTQKEYKNRFVNPITNGQCSDSTSRDVRIMKHRAHILHDLLSGCVQRKDYSVITKFLPPKHEYVVSIRLSPEQIKLYEVYLGQYSGMKRDGDAPYVQQRSASIFADYQSLMRIWTHPQVLKLNTIREENKQFNDFDGFITSDDESDPGSIDDFLDDRNSDSELEEVAPEKPAPIIEENSRGTRSSRRGRSAQQPAQNGNKVKKEKGSSDEDGDGGGNKSDSSLEIIKTWKTRSRTLDPEGDGDYLRRSPTPPPKNKEWYDDYFDQEKDAYNLNLSGKLILLFEILRHCEQIGEKILVFSQSLLSLDLIEDFLEHLNKQAEDDRDKGEQDLENQIGGSGAWIKGEDYFRMDGSTSPAYRQRWCDIFNEKDNLRARLFLISTKAGSLGINLVGANRVIIFDASWNPSHDTQSIFRVYRFGQERPVFIYRFVAQGTMEEKIYERQVAKQSLSQRVVDEHQIERHFSAGQLSELYNFTPDRLDDPDRKEQPTPALPKDHILAELLEDKKDWIVKYHEHDSLLENKIEEELSEEDRKAAWDEYNAEKEGRYTAPLMRDQIFGNQTSAMLQRLYQDGSHVLQAGQNVLGNQQYNTVTINGVQYRVPVSNQAQSMLMRQYQALQQQQQQRYNVVSQQQLLQQQQQQQQQQAGTATQVGSQNISQLLSTNYAAARNNHAANYSTMSNLLARMSQTQQQNPGSHMGMPAASLYSALKRQAEQQKQQQNGDGGGTQ